MIWKIMKYSIILIEFEIEIKLIAITLFYQIGSDICWAPLQLYLYFTDRIGFFEMNSNNAIY